MIVLAVNVETLKLCSAYKIKDTSNALRIFAKTPTALAAFYRIRKGQKIIKPKKDLSFAPPCNGPFKLAIAPVIAP